MKKLASVTIFVTLAMSQLALAEVTTLKNKEPSMSGNDQYLKQNATQKGVVTLKNGIQYQVLEEGSGKFPTAASKVTVHYQGELTDGRVFDSSYKRGEPAKFNVNQVIVGWQDVLVKMKEGSVWRVVIPPSLAYGKNGIPGVIPPDSILVFKIQLLKA
jgi:FKBP-type peptidyl-prolyl cis-trans isomerase FkpA